MVRFHSRVYRIDASLGDVFGMLFSKHDGKGLETKKMVRIVSSSTRIPFRFSKIYPLLVQLPRLIMVTCNSFGEQSYHYRIHGVLLASIFSEVELLISGYRSISQTLCTKEYRFTIVTPRDHTLTRL